MSIFAAEIRGRTTEQDRLISRFFGTVGIADREHVLGNILAEIGVDVARSDLSQINIEFWQPYFRATPAVLLEGESTLVFVEVPQEIAEERERLLAEFEEGLKGSSHFALVTVTRDATEPPAIAELREEIANRHKSGRLIWTNWSTLYKKTHGLSAVKELDEVSRRLLSDLLVFLEEQGLSGFVGFPPEAYERVVLAQRDLRSFARHTQSFVAEATAALERERISPLALDEGPVTLGGGLRFPAHLKYPFCDEEWDAMTAARCHLYLKIFLDAPLMWAGYRLDLSDAAQRAFLTEKRGVLTPVLAERSDAMLVLQNGEGQSGVVRTVLAGDGGLGFLESRDALAGVEHADLVLPFGEEELASEDLPSGALERLVWLREKVNEAGLFPAPRSESENRFVVTNV